MAISYSKLAKKPLIFLRLTGVKLEEFQTICARVQPVWETQVESKKQCEGRHSRLRSLEDKVLALLIYYRTYITHEFVGYLFNLHSANVCRLFKKLEPMLAKTLTIKKDRSLTPDKLIKLLEIGRASCRERVL